MRIDYAMQVAGLRPDALTPREALDALYHLKDLFARAREG